MTPMTPFEQALFDEIKRLRAEIELLKNKAAVPAQPSPLPIDWTKIRIGDPARSLQGGSLSGTVARTL